jgi:methyl-accepting chemotaxis protein
MGLKTILTGFLSRQPGSDRTSHPDEVRVIGCWAEQLLAVGERLDAVVASSEERFLTLVERLQDFYQRAEDMSTRSHEMVELMSGEGIQKTTEGLRDILQELRVHLENPEYSTQRTRAVFREHLRAIRSLTSFLDEFGTLVMNLSMLGFLTQVENAYLSSESTGFTSLTDDVRLLADTIKARALSIRSSSESVHAYLVRALGEISVFETTKGEQARTMLDKAFENHRSLLDRHAAASGSALRIDQGTRKIASSIAQIVMSLQFHDITRQQIEHVQEVLRTIAGTITEDTHSGAEKASFVKEVCGLQAAQLAQSRDDLTRAMLAIITNLHSISRSVGDILKDAWDAALASESSGSTFMEDIDQGISSVIRSMRNASDEQERLCTTITSASEMASEMTVFVRDIEGLGLGLQLVALNARIKAAHLGHGGAALDTISGSIYDLSTNARDDTKQLSVMLGDLVSLSESFHEEFRDMHSRQTVVTDRLVERLRDLITSLHDINKAIRTMLSELSGLGESLMRDIEDAASHIAVHREIETALNGVRQTLAGIIDDARKRYPAARLDASSPFFAAIDRLYTMESERAVHLRHLSASSAFRDGAMAPAEAGDTGGNLELF